MMRIKIAKEQNVPFALDKNMEMDSCTGSGVSSCNISCFGGAQSDFPDLKKKKGSCLVSFPGKLTILSIFLKSGN